uniref:Putative secreted protein n=1 Tax=Anopheles darlingi TaxID=43151 RepID=A0A2M4DC64_ANODA
MAAQTSVCFLWPTHATPVGIIWSSALRKRKTVRNSHARQMCIKIKRPFFPGIDRNGNGDCAATNNGALQALEQNAAPQFSR